MIEAKIIESRLTLKEKFVTRNLVNWRSKFLLMNVVNFMMPDEERRLEADFKEDMLPLTNHRKIN